jgi:hypothetical protein
MMSRYATVWSSSTLRLPIGPFGETLTWPSSARGAVPTKKSACRAIQARWWSSMRS